MNSFLVILATLPIVVSSCTQNKNIPLAEVGRYTITRVQLDNRAKLNSFEIPPPNLETTFEQLIDIYTKAEIIQKYHYPINQDLLEKESSRIDKTTHWPTRLQQIKDLFGQKRADYVDTVIFPAYVTRTIYSEVFLNSPKAQEASKKGMERVLNEIKKNPDKAEKIATAASAAFATIRVIEKNKELTFDTIKLPTPGKISAAMPTPKPSAKQKEWLNKVIRSNQGKVFPEIMSENGVWQIARYLGSTTYPQKGKVHQIQMISIPKQDFNEWYQIEKRDIPVKRRVTHFE